MKLTFNALICLIIFVCFASRSSAQAIPDSARLVIGAEFDDPTGSISDRYTFGVGASVGYEIPFAKHSYFTLSVGFNDFSVGNGSLTTPQAILNVPVPTLQILPMKVGYKYFLKHLYVQAQVGETLLVNKKAQYANSSLAFAYSPGIGFLFNTKTRNYIDAGIRYEGGSSYYAYNFDKYNFWAVHISYSFKL